jgi:hypothetical protein
MDNYGATDTGYVGKKLHDGGAVNKALSALNFKKGHKMKPGHLLQVVYLFKPLFVVQKL